MNALILDGSRQGDDVLEVARKTIEEELKKNGWEINSFILRDITIAPCKGCFDCWLKTPGICVTNDKGRFTTSIAAKSDMWVVLTRVTFGGYSAELKKSLDRIIPLLLPFFIKINGEVHHKRRYEMRPSIFAIGLLDHLDNEKKSIFDCIVRRNAINIHSPTCVSEILLADYKDEEIAKKVKEALVTLEANRCS